VLSLVLLLVLAAFGLLIAALTTANTLWAWLSVVVSVVAAALLVSDWLRGRRRVMTGGRPPVASPADTAEPDDDVSDEPDFDTFEPEDRTPVRSETPSGWRSSADAADDRLDLGYDSDLRGAVEDPKPAEPPALDDPVYSRSGVGDEVEPERTVALRHPPRDAAPLDPEREPDEEDTDAADLLVVSGLGVEVRVLDERPRYHLSRCAWLAARPSIPLPLSEARQLGFTPCGVCTPDAVVSARHRSGRGARQPRS